MDSSLPRFNYELVGVRGARQTPDAIGTDGVWSAESREAEPMHDAGQEEIPLHQRQLHPYTHPTTWREIEARGGDKSIRTMSLLKPVLYQILAASALRASAARLGATRRG